MKGFTTHIYIYEKITRLYMMIPKFFFCWMVLFFFLIIPAEIMGSTGGDIYTPHLVGSDLSISWVIPFVGILLSIALFPLVAPTFWHHHFGKVTFFWGGILLLSMAIQKGLPTTFYEFLHVGFLEYAPFIILLLALFTISGGIRLTGKLVGSPIVNTGIIIVGTILASWMGTTGAAILLIRPLIRANIDRKHKVHVVVFFIFLVANIGGSLTPLGDPPLFLGFLKGVDFFWTTKAMLEPMLFVVVLLLILFYTLDSFYYRKEDLPDPLVKVTDESGVKLGLEGTFNFLLLAGVMFSVLLSGIWHPELSFTVFHVEIELQNITRDILLLVLTGISWKMTPKDIRRKNEFTWFPIQEVSILFAGIFITIIPAIAILKVGADGALAGVINSVSYNGNPVNVTYFWATGILSSFLDNAPTYLVFFNTAGGDAVQLMGELYTTLLAISAGAVFMGATTYIGNAPNFMVKSISEEAGITMPSFFGYMLKYSFPILIPIFILVSVIFF